MGWKVALELNMARITKIFSLCCAAFKASILREELIRKQESEGLARNLHHITGATPALRRGGKRFARIAESIPYHHQLTNAKRCSPCSDALDEIRVAVPMLTRPFVHQALKGVNINIYHFLDAKRAGRISHHFRSRRELAMYM
jgi:hypothetical protein